MKKKEGEKKKDKGDGSQIFIDPFLFPGVPTFNGTLNTFASSSLEDYQEPRWKLGIIPRGSRGYLAILDYSSMFPPPGLFHSLSTPFLLRLSSNRSTLVRFQANDPCWLIMVSRTILWVLLRFDTVKRNIYIFDKFSFNKKLGDV